MVEFEDSEALKRWLEGQPREAAIAIAARAALRVLPLLADVLEDDAERRRADIILPVFRATAAPRVAAVGPTRGAKVAAYAGDAAVRAAYAADAAVRATYAASGHAAYAAYAATYAASNIADAALAAGHAADAADAAANAAGAAARAAVSADATALEQGRSAEDLVAAPLWPNRPPKVIAEGWSALSAHLLAADEDWEVWTNWYEDCLHGRPFDTALEEDRVLIAQGLWDQGPKAVNAEIAQVITDRAADKTPTGERLVVRKETGQIAIESAPISEAGGYDNACDKVYDRYQQLINKGHPNWLPFLEPVANDLEQSFARHRGNPRRMHDSFATGVRNIAALLEAGEVPDDLLVTNLQKDMADGVIDIREAVPEVKRMVEARTRARMTVPPEATFRAIGLIVSEAGEAFEPIPREEIAEDAAHLEHEAEQVADRDTPLPEGESKDRAYRLFGRLAQLLRMARAPNGEIWAACQSAVEAKPHLAKVLEVLNAAEVFWSLIRWLM